MTKASIAVNTALAWDGVVVFHVCLVTRNITQIHMMYHHMTLTRLKSPIDSVGA